MNAIQIPTKPTLGTRIGNFVFKSFLIATLFLVHQSAYSQDCTLSWTSGKEIPVSSANADCITHIRPFDIIDPNPFCAGGVFSLVVLDPSNGDMPVDASDMDGAQLDKSHIGKELKAVITFVDASAVSQNAVALFTLVDKTAPIIMDEYATISCFDDIRPESEQGDVPNMTILDCSDFTASYVDSETFYDCNSEEGVNLVGLIERSWTATDIFGNSNTAIQYINIARVGLGSGLIERPENEDLSCSASEAMKSPANTGYPTLTVGMKTYDLIPNDAGYCDLHIHYSDFINDFNFCPGEYQIVRTWTIRDLCYPEEDGVNPITLIQKINIIDEVGPQISGINDIVVGTNNNDCSATVSFLPPTITDDCSVASVSIITDFGQIGDARNGGAINDIPAGDHIITYRATDACGNVTNKEITLSVKDDDAPNVVCDQFTVVPLNVDGFAQVMATSFDDGSTDNCEIVSYEVARMASACGPETAFQSFVDFTCCDLSNNPIMVALKVSDAAGNFNICMIEVTVQDKTAPLITCPPNKELDCTDDYTNTALTGKPYVSDNTDHCTEVTITYEDEVDLNNCGWGTVTRKWIAEDAAGEISECYQIITISNLNPFDGEDITWPEDYSATDCGAVIHPDSLPHPYGRPGLGGQNCDNIKSYFLDKAIGEYADVACYAIERSWTVTDLCIYDPNNPMAGGQWTYVQRIYINDNTKPVFVKGHENEEILVDGNCRDITYTIMAEVEDCSPNLTYYYEIDLSNDGSVDSMGIAQMMELSFFTEGTHKISWRVTDGCDNQETTSQLIKFTDTKDPVANMKAIFVSLMPINGGMIEVNASQFNNSSNDNCTPIGWLRYSFSEDVDDNVRMFTCADEGQNNVNVYVHDTEGNFAFAETFVDIQDNNDLCSDNMMPTVFGLITTPNGEAIANVAVDLEGSDMNALMTDELGGYEISALPAGEFKLKPSKNVEPMNGVSTYDMVLMQRHILGITDISDPYTMIAADVNNSGTVSTSDMVQMRKLILNIDENFNNTPSWRFVLADHDFNSNAGTSFPEEYSLDNPSNDMEIDFIGIKIGDVNANASTTDLLGGIEIDGEPLTFAIQDQVLESGESYEVAFTAKDFKDVIGFQYTLQFDEDAIEVTSIESGAIELTEQNHNLDEIGHGLVATNWFNALPMTLEDNSALFIVNVVALNDTKLSDILQLGSEKTRAESYRQSSLSSPLLTGETLINFIQPEVNVEGFELSQNMPNPFSMNSIIKIAVPTKVDGMLTIYDVTGKAIKVWNQTFDKGNHQIEISANELPDGGVYYYQFEAENFTATKKMIFIK